MRTIEERFWSKVDRREPHICWPWLARRNGKGYGQIWFDNRMEQAPRAAWQLAVGPIPEGLKVLHTCDNPPCCNPAHLYVGTIADNHADMVRRGRQVLPPIGERHWNSKLKEADVLAIRALKAQGVPTKDVAVMFGVNRSTIKIIIRGITWKNCYATQ